MSGPEISAWLVENWPWLAGGVLAGVVWSAIRHAISEVAIDRSWRAKCARPVGQRPVVTLSDFLHARITEDEVRAQEDSSREGQTRRAICRIQRRQLARCAGRTEPFAERALADLAAAYSKHPAYQQEWKP